MNEISKVIITFLLVVLLTSTLHWTLHVLYSMWCAPHTVKGLLNSLFTLGSPLCQFINHIQFELAKNYITIWTTAGVAVMGYITSKILNK